jgi:hypothetical protein
MNAKLVRLAERRKRLILQAAAQRSLLAHNFESLRGPLMLADKGVSAVRYLKSHPFWIAVIVFTVTALRPGRFAEKLRRGLIVWQIAQRFFSR